MEYETVIGLEVHVQLLTRSKLFCGCSTLFGAQPNSQTCPVCLGLPGSLPVLNREAFRKAVKVGLALHGEISQVAKFDRKNYFYPDLPKNYQISQYDLPIARGGWLDVGFEGGPKRVRITRAHLEEDAGKLMHVGKGGSRVDFNRTGTPLLEIVSEPDISSPQEAALYLSELKAILLYLEVSDCNMEEGSLRCDANISVRRPGSKELGVKSELKNMNSFKAVERALEFEVSRHRRVLEEGGRLIQETRLWDERQAVTQPMRSKEEAHDYRYFPEPDLVPFRISQAEVDEIRSSLGELPRERLNRFQTEYELSAYDAGVLVSDKALSEFFEAVCRAVPRPKQVANWLTGPVLSEMNARHKTIRELGLKPEALAKLLMRIEDRTLTNTMAKEILPALIDSGKDPDEVVRGKGLKQVSDAGALEPVVEQVIRKNGQSVQDFLSGKERALGFLVGQVMKETGGKANPALAHQLLLKALAVKKGGAL
ncbi:MAG: Asp-tRNA(Asn)/Glu-tRNA(Gln) amidotransferase subunit GatB [Candidatus Omnitrophica bacterium]|nr:Asp-tRNA(Asn)/Glu-tRNA(Gln) amidotransferase subunit GatB [Candidatus Omnitrophota bacterium]